jgi:gluconolactonase
MAFAGSQIYHRSAQATGRRCISPTPHSDCQSSSAIRERNCLQRSVFAPGRKAPALSTGLTDPNGIAFSPDEKFLYVTNWDDKKKVVMRYDAHADGTVSNGRLFFDMTSAPGEEALDGVKVDRQGNLHVSGPGGLWVLSPEGRHLGTIVPPKHPHNFAWGDEDGKTLYLCARSGLYRMRLGIAGIRL